MAVAGKLSLAHATHKITCIGALGGVGLAEQSDTGGESVDEVPAAHGSELTAAKNTGNRNVAEKLT